MQKRVFRLLGFLIGLPLFLAGCAHAPRVPAPPALIESRISAYGLAVTAESAPREVAALLLRGLDNGDGDLLARLAAVEDIMAELERVYRRYGKESKLTREQAVRVAVSGWLAAYAAFERGATGISGERVEGKEATVYCLGRSLRTGQRRRLEVELVRENGWWKARLGLRNSAAE